ncbi:MAG: ABC transporter ATP-binding protein [Thermodesulfovibrionales bacterium]|nr:ABC transporter ATP-binding protein [Thermodesulfovibrionales bacterium]MDP3048279.1 ABC transporter ATP-binding protein [Thermodesulfovibrionales bacterium]
MIEVKGLKKSFFLPAGEVKVLSGIDLSISRGEMLAIVGVSGAGKSTLLHIMGTLDEPTSGNVLYENKDVFSLDDYSLAGFRNKSIGFVFQFHHLLPEFTAYENVLMPGLINMSGYEEIKERAEMLLGELGLSERKNHRPGELSGGEQQRVAVARALINEPKVVFADEPTGNLDAHTGEELFKLLLRLNEKKGITFVIVTHNESLSRQCHRVLEMADGKFR